MATGAAIAVVAVAAAVSAYGQEKAASAAKKAGIANANAAKFQSAEDARRSERDSAMLLGRQRAIAAAQGTTLEGSPLLIVEDTASEAEIEALHIRKGGAARAGAELRAGNAAGAAGNLQAGATLLGGVGQAFGMAA